MSTCLPFAGGTARGNRSPHFASPAAGCQGSLDRGLQRVESLRHGAELLAFAWTAILTFLGSSWTRRQFEVPAAWDHVLYLSMSLRFFAGPFVYVLFAGERRKALIFTATCFATAGVWYASHFAYVLCPDGSRILVLSLRAGS